MDSRSAEIDILMDIEEWLPIEIASWVNFHSKRLGVPKTYVVMPLLITVTYLSKVNYKIFHNDRDMDIHTEPIILYSMVVGESGTNKSPCLNLFLELLDAIPNSFNAEHTYETGTIDGLMKTMSLNNGCAIGLYDEISTFNDGLDKHTSSSFDRSIYLSLYNGKKFKKDTKNSGDVNIPDPRFSLFIFSQEHPVHDFIVNNSINGFFQRFLISFPPEIGITMEEKKYSFGDSCNYRHVKISSKDLRTLRIK